MPAQAIGFDALPGISDASLGSLLEADGSGKAAWVLPKLAYAASQLSFSPTLSVAWETASAAILFPFTLTVPQTCSEMIISAGGTNSGNFDVGIYDATGTLKVSKGSTAQSTRTTNIWNRVAVTATALAVGQYWMALVADNTTGTWTQVTGGLYMTPYYRKVTSAFPLPASLTLGSTTPSNEPLIAVTLS